MPKPALNLVRAARLPILTQLCLEEALLRATKDNWLIVNDGAFNPAIVLGISGKPQELVQVPAAVTAGVQAIKRFTGGGTVVVDHDTIFASIIVQGSSLPAVDCFPQPIMQWTEQFYAGVFPSRSDFRLRENDYVFGERKFGGNAQAITGKRWLHHTSLLWDFDPARMALLKQPAKAPKYRQSRAHEDFIVRLRDYVATRQEVLDGLVRAAHQHFDVTERNIAEASFALRHSPMINTKVLDLREYAEQGAA